MKLKRSFAVLLTLCLVLSGCSNPSAKETETPTKDNAADVTELDITTMFSKRDQEIGYDEKKCAYIELKGNTASCSSNAVEINGSTITIKDEGTYVLSGTLNNGMIIVNADEKDKTQLILNNVNITSDTCAPIYIYEADKVFITLSEGTENTLINGGIFTAIDESNIDAVIFSKQDLTLNGSGSLTISSPAGHGIECNDDLVFTGGIYRITCASHGLNANDSVRITNANITIDAGKDGIQAENTDDTTLGFIYVADGTLTIDAEGDGISAESILQIDGGDFSIISGGGSENGNKTSSDNWGGFPGGFGGPGGIGGHPDSSSNNSSTTDEDGTSMKALKATGNLVINSGSFTIDCADDAVHANSNVTITEGSFSIATGDDGFHADNTLTILAGNIDISESYEGLEAHKIYVKGGNIRLTTSDDGLNAAGGNDSSGTGGRDDMFGGAPGGGPGGFGGGPGGKPGGFGNGSSDGVIEISDGNLYINSSGDGIDANGSLTISGGYTVICGPTQGDTAILDYDVSGTITGGTFIGTGASTMAQTFNDSKNQGVFAIRSGNISAGTEFTLTDQKGNIIISHCPELSYAVIILSSPDIQSGETYTITIGSGESAASGSFEAQ